MMDVGFYDREDARAIAEDRRLWALAEANAHLTATDLFQLLAQRIQAIGPTQIVLHLSRADLTIKKLRQSVYEVSVVEQSSEAE